MPLVQANDVDILRTSCAFGKHPGKASSMMRHIRREILAVDNEAPELDIKTAEDTTQRQGKFNV